MAAGRRTFLKAERELGDRHCAVLRMRDVVRVRWRVREADADADGRRTRADDHSRRTRTIKPPPAPGCCAAPEQRDVTRSPARANRGYSPP